MSGSCPPFPSLSSKKNSSCHRRNLRTFIILWSCQVNILIWNRKGEPKEEWFPVTVELPVCTLTTQLRHPVWQDSPQGWCRGNHITLVATDALQHLQTLRDFWYWLKVLWLITAIPCFEPELSRSGLGITGVHSLCPRFTEITKMQVSFL